MQSNKSVDWSFHISAQKASGSSQQAYCKANNLKFNSFSYQYLKRKGNEPRIKKGSRKRETFLPISIKSSSHISSYELILPSGESLKVSKGFDLREVKDLIALIKPS